MKNLMVFQTRYILQVKCDITKGTSDDVPFVAICAPHSICFALQNVILNLYQKYCVKTASFLLLKRVLRYNVIVINDDSMLRHSGNESEAQDKTERNSSVRFCLLYPT